MRTVTGYLDGKPQWSSNEPARASMPTSRGGLTLGQALSMVTVAHRGLHGEPSVRPEALLAAANCGVPTVQGPCARGSGHLGSNHRSRSYMDRENAQRLITRAPMGGRR